MALSRVSAVTKSRLEELMGDLAYRAASSTRLRQKVFNACRLRRASVQRIEPIREVRFLAYLFAERHRSRAQIMQDLWVCFELGNQRNGFFVEFGATDGRTNSNTAVLEAEYGWRGILAEPNPAWHPALGDNRSAAMDPRCVAAHSGETVDFLVVEDPELSTIAAYATQDHFATLRSRAPKIAVQTVALNDLLADHDAPPVIDYISIDTEGSELDILTTFDFDRWRVRLFSIEHNNTERESQLDTLMAQHGYRRVFAEFSQWDAWYRHEDVG